MTTEPPSVADLNQRVTAAILRAEALPDDSERALALREVAGLEEQLAAALSGQTLEGRVARDGAVRAHLGSGNPLRAIQLAEQYLGEAVGAGVASELEYLRQKAITVATDTYGAGWQPIDSMPEGIELLTRVLDATGERLVQKLRRSGRLFFGGASYVYYTPTHWRVA